MFSVIVFVNNFLAFIPRYHSCPNIFQHQFFSQQKHISFRTMDYDPEAAADDTDAPSELLSQSLYPAPTQVINSQVPPPPPPPSLASSVKRAVFVPPPPAQSSAPPLPPSLYPAPPPPPAGDQVADIVDHGIKLNASDLTMQQALREQKDREERERLIANENMKQRTLASKSSMAGFIGKSKKPVRGFERESDSDSDDGQQNELARAKPPATKTPGDLAVSVAVPASLLTTAPGGVSAQDLERARTAAAALAQAARLKQQQIQLPQVPQQHLPAPAAAPSSSSSLNEQGGRKRKSRWGEAPTAASITPNIAVSSASVIASHNRSADTPVFANEEERQSWERRIKEQKELQLLESRIRQAAAQSFSTGGAGAGGSEKDEALFRERLREYEELAARYDEKFKDTVEDAEANDGVIEGGTWEHRKRAKEMLDTARRNLEITALAAGHHHIGDFLPKQELDRFLRKADAVKTGASLPTEADYESQKLTADNLGYQMLLKSGWKEGTSLGAVSTSNNSSSGVLSSAGAETRLTAPLNAAGQSTESVGLGIHATHEPEAQDNEFDQYRKRMMLAYRFRPNPLNNPRRDYY